MKKIISYRPRMILCALALCIADGAARGLGAPAPAVLNGIDALAERDFKELQNLRVGLITNHTGTDRRRNAAIDLLHASPHVKLKALFSPEHGIRGKLDQSRIDDGVDEKTGLPIYSLYGKTRKPLPEHLKRLDALVFDIQDIGCRFYTYISTMGNAMEAASENKLKFFVLDRVNPIGGATLDGPVMTGKTDFVGYHPIPVRHGMTVGELARMFNAEKKIQVDLTVIPAVGWKRAMWFDETGLPWTNPSPNMRSLAQAALYPGVGLVETTNLSVGRGTDTPFEVVGAPWIDDLQLAAELNRAGLRGVRFVPVRFTPDASKFKGQECRGVNIFLTDRDLCPVVDIGVTLALVLRKLYPADFEIDRFARLLKHDATLAAVKRGESLGSIKAMWSPDLAQFDRRRRAFLLYD